MPDRTNQQQDQPDHQADDTQRPQQRDPEQETQDHQHDTHNDHDPYLPTSEHPMTRADLILGIPEAFGKKAVP